MEVNWTNKTSTSYKIIDGLRKSGIVLKPEDKQLIIDEVYDAIISSVTHKSNGCDCGQMWCPTCHG
jgi:hydrogenase maturation factor